MSKRKKTFTFLTEDLELYMWHCRSRTKSKAIKRFEKIRPSKTNFIVHRGI